MTVSVDKPKQRKPRIKRPAMMKHCRNERDERFVSAGGWFDVEAADHVTDFFPTFLRHTIDPYAGQPFELAPWQRDEIVRPTMGWMRPDGTRRYRRVWVEIPKKNGKTTLLAGWKTYFLAADSEEVPICLIVATTLRQACLTWDEAARMVRWSPHLRTRLTIHESTKQIVNAANSGKLQAVAADAAGLHGENPYVMGLDEIHAWKTRSVWESVRYAGVARANPLMICITTAGIVDESSIGWTEHRKALKIQGGTLEDDETLVYIRAADEKDDILDPKVHAKANPSYGITIKANEIAAAAKNAQGDSTEFTNFLRLRLNIWVQAYKSWLEPGEWDKGNGAVDETSLEGRQCFGGLDFGPVDDLTAWVLCFPPNGDAMIGGSDDEANDKFIFLWRFFCTAKRAEIVEREGGAPYFAWSNDGFLKLCTSDSVDFPTIFDKIMDDSKRFQIQGIAVDDHDISDLIRQLRDEDLQLTEWSQGPGMMSGPNQEFKRILCDGKVRHCNNPIARWMAGNAVEKNSGEYQKLDKGKSTGKIDGMVSALMALGLYCVSQKAAPAEVHIYR